jgi:hypothetical protein
MDNDYYEVMDVVDKQQKKEHPILYRIYYGAIWLLCIVAVAFIAFIVIWFLSLI